MLEILTGTGLAAAAGLNAYIPLLLLGLAGRFVDVVQLPTGWGWLENEWVLVVLAVLLVIEVVADKVPAVDTVNDWIQTVVRPASGGIVFGGIVFGGGSGSETAAVPDPAAFLENDRWVPVAIGVGIALLVHLAKATIRPVLNTLTFGLAAPVASTVEDAGSVALSFVALIAPVLVVLVLVALGVGVVLVLRRVREQRRTAATRR